MANFGAKYPVFAPFKGAEPTDTLPKYDTKTVLGKLVSANLTVNLSSGEQYADDEMCEQISEFASGTLAMETNDMTAQEALDEIQAQRLYTGPRWIMNPTNLHTREQTQSRWADLLITKCCRETARGCIKDIIIRK